MRGYALGIWLGLAGCNQVFGLEPTQLIDAGESNGGPRDGLLFPPDGTTECGSRPAFESWQFAEATLLFDRAATEFTFYRRAAGVHAIALSGNAFYDVAPDGSSTRLASLDPPANATVRNPRVAPDGETLWFVQSGVGMGVYYARRASGWTQRVADLGFLDAELVDPGTPGFYAGTARMVITVRTFDGSATLHEVSSLDGITWTPLQTIRFAMPGFGAGDGFLSENGCYLVFTARPTNAEIHVASRDADGNFTTAVKLAAPSSLSSAPSSPVVSPGEDALWFASNVAGEITHYRGMP